MEAGEKGLLATDLKFGSPQGIAETLLDIARRRSRGAELADGTRRLAEKYGGREFAINIKGLEMAAYDPRGAWGQGLSYAVANRGACHLSAYVLALEIYFGLLHPDTTRAKPEFVRLFENATCCVNSLQTCQFTMFAYTLESPLTKYTPDPVLAVMMQYLPAVATRLVDFSMYAKFFATVTGIDMSTREFLTAGERIHVLERYMNTREGISRKDDTLPKRMLDEGRRDDPRHLTVPLEPMLARYYRLRGYNNDGIPTGDALDQLGIVAK